MATDDVLRQQIEEYRGRIAELTDELRRVTDERDGALREIARLRGEFAGTDAARASVEPEGASDLVACAFCDGEGVYWVHDFEMPCKRCDGTGFVPRGSAEVAPDRH